MNTFVTSDLHLGHGKEFLYKSRGFDSIEEHDRTLVKNWNETVSADDTVYILGDIMLKHTLEDTEFEYGLSLLRRLNGKLIIIRGNHDSMDKLERYKTCPNVIRADLDALYLNYPEVGSYHFYLSHYPCLVSQAKLKPVKTALINLFGHTHQKETFFTDPGVCEGRFANGHPYMYHVGMDSHNMRPARLDDIIEDVRRKRAEYHDETPR